MIITGILVHVIITIFHDVVSDYVVKEKKIFFRLLGNDGQFYWVLSYILTNI